MRVLIALVLIFTAGCAHTDEANPLHWSSSVWREAKQLLPPK